MIKMSWIYHLSFEFDKDAEIWIDILFSKIAKLSFLNHYIYTRRIVNLIIKWDSITFRDMYVCHSE